MKPPIPFIPFHTDGYNFGQDRSIASSPSFDHMLSLFDATRVAWELCDSDEDDSLETLELLLRDSHIRSRDALISVVDAHMRFEAAARLYSFISEGRRTHPDGAIEISKDAA